MGVLSQNTVKLGVVAREKDLFGVLGRDKVLLGIWPLRRSHEVKAAVTPAFHMKQDHVLTH